MPTSEKIAILNVDDVPDSLRIKSFILLQAGFEVIEAMTGKEALWLTSSKNPQLVLLDVNLPDLSGFEVCRRIKSDPHTASTLVIQISACFVKSSDRARGLDQGADGYLTSPIDPPLLIATINSLLRLRESGQHYSPLHHWQPAYEEIEVAALLLDGRGEIIKANAAALRLLNLADQPLEGCALSDRLVQESKPIPGVTVLGKNAPCSQVSADCLCQGMAYRLIANPRFNLQGEIIATLCFLLPKSSQAPPEKKITPPPEEELTVNATWEDEWKTVISTQDKMELGGMASYNPSMQQIFKMLPQIAVSQSIILIQGETGTGKEILARTLHNMSPRANQPFIALNCCALPDSLLESELFGYKAGAFTGAVKDKPGRFALAGNGTLFLDEIGDISPTFQVKLLRVLQEHTYEPLGSNIPENTFARIIVATNKNLAELVKRDCFRADLFYRINVIRLDLPPLRDRKEDIPLLVDYFIEKFNRTSDKTITGMESTAWSCLLHYNFPGNIRELENLIEHAFILCAGGLIKTMHLPESLRMATASAQPGSPSGNDLRSLEAQAIIEGLKRHGFNRLATARSLGIHKATLFRKIRELGIKLPKIDGRTRPKERSD